MRNVTTNNDTFIYLNKIWKTTHMFIYEKYQSVMFAFYTVIPRERQSLVDPFPPMHPLTHSLQFMVIFCVYITN